MAWVWVSAADCPDVSAARRSARRLARPVKFLYPLHQPYHRHVFSVDALLAAGHDLGWQLERYYSTPYTNQPIPFLSLPFLHHYFRCFDNNLDLVFERPLASAKLWLNPWTFFMAFFGYFLCDDADIVAIFRKPQCSSPAANTLHGP